jgi:hypothetical protein
LLDVFSSRPRGLGCLRMCMRVATMCVVSVSLIEGRQRAVALCCVYDGWLLLHPLR